ncbi:MAG: glycogen debranching enzyme [Gemmataceae bacterium]|nr:glycogen debranching enzyme [Gemmataceae bacterium]
MSIPFRLRSCCGLLAVGIVLAGAPSTALAATLGTSFDADGTTVTFAVYSSGATRIEVSVYANATGEDAKATYELTLDPGTRVWTKTVAVADLRQKGVTGAVLYGYRAWGPNWPFDPAWRKGTATGFVADFDDAGNRFNPNKLLLDPYAREVTHDYLTPAQRDGSIYQSGADRATDTGSPAPKGIVLPAAPKDFGVKPVRPFKDDIVYEVHLRGLTMGVLDESVPAAERGTYAGAARRAADLKALGVTAVEFLPVFEFQNDTNGLTPGSAVGDNYWGYDPNSFFAPDRRYSSNKAPGGPTREFREMVKAFHDQGLKVYLDVVFNHTGEGDAEPTTGTTARLHSWRGLDNPTYYEVRDDNASPTNLGRPNQWRKGGFYVNNNGVGPNLNAANRVVRDMVIDSLKYWSEEMGVDGFRFDLAALLGNTLERGGFRFDKIPGDNILNRAARDLPARGADGRGVELIAEPYAIGDGTFQLGSFPTGWCEWNDRFRYPFRKSQNKLGVIQDVTPADLIRHFAGSSDLFQPNGRKPYHGVNYIVCHDGFTLRDLYSYRSKRNNQPFPLGPSEGGADDGQNLSWDSGGDAALQRRAARNGLALVLVSAGVPMVLGGDEMYRTQFGNNNPSNLDNEKFYLDYQDRHTHARHFAYTKALLAFRHAHPVFRRADFYDGRDHNGNGLKDVTWLTDDGAEADAGYLDNPANHFIAFRLDGTEAAGEPASSVYVAYNGWKDDITATLPANLPGTRWRRAFDTATAHEPAGNHWQPPAPVTGPTYKVAARSVVLLVESP